MVPGRRGSLPGCSAGRGLLATRRPACSSAPSVRPRRDGKALDAVFRPATGELRGEPAERTTNAVLHPWLKRELSAILEQCPPAPATPPLQRRWVDWRWQEGAEGLDRHLPPIRMLLIWDNLKGHVGRTIVQWCAERGICLLYRPIAGSWLNMAESVQRIS
jgi:hypothetical protein